MKKFNYFRTLLCAILAFAAAGLTSCKEDPTTPPDPTNPFAIVVSGNEITNVTAKISFDNTEYYSRYAVAVFPASESTLTSAQLADKVLEAIKTAGGSLDAVDSKYVFDKSADVKVSDIWTLAYSTKYTVAAVAIDATGKAISLSESKDFTTADEEVTPEPETADLELTIDETNPGSIVVSVAQSEGVGNYYLAILDKAQFEAVYSSDAQAYAEYLIQSDIEDYGVNFDEADGYYVFDSSVEQFDLSQAWLVSSSTEYVVFAFGVEGAEGNITTEIFTDETTTPAFDESTNVAMTVESVTYDDIVVNCEPNAAGDNYMIFTLPTADFVESFYSNPSLLASGSAYYLAGYGYVEADGQYIFDEAATIPASNLTLIKPETEYTVIAFAVNSEMMVISNVTVETVTTEAQPELGEVGAMSASDITSSSAVVSVEEGTYEGIYYVCTYNDEFVAEEEAGDGLVAYLESLLGMRYNWGIMDFTEVNGKNLFQGAATVDLAATGEILAPNANYTTFAMGVSEEGKVITELSSVSFTTGDVQPSDNTITITISDITEESAQMLTTPSNNDPYLSDCIPAATFDEFVTDETDISALVGTYYDGFWAYYTARGEMDLMQYPLIAGTEYCALAFGCEGGINTTPLTVERFVTLGTPPASKPTEITLSTEEFGTIVVGDDERNGSGYQAATATSDDSEMFMCTGYKTKEEFESLSEAELIQGIYDYYDALCVSFGFTFSKGMDMFTDQGESYEVLNDVKDGVEYVYYAFGVDMATYQPATKVESVEFTGSSAPASSAAYTINTIPHRFPTAKEIAIAQNKCTVDGKPIVEMPERGLAPAAKTPSTVATSNEVVRSIEVDIKKLKSLRRR